MTTEAASKILEVIRTQGAVKAENGDFNQIVFRYSNDNDTFSMSRKYWSESSAQVMFEERTFSPSEFQAFISTLYPSEIDFTADFGV